MTSDLPSSGNGNVVIEPVILPDDNEAALAVIRSIFGRREATPPPKEKTPDQEKFRLTKREKKTLEDFLNEEGGAQVRSKFAKLVMQGKVTIIAPNSMPWPPPEGIVEHLTSSCNSSVAEAKNFIVFYND